MTHNVENTLSNNIVRSSALDGMLSAEKDLVVRDLQEGDFENIWRAHHDIWHATYAHMHPQEILDKNTPEFYFREWRTFVRAYLQVNDSHRPWHSTTVAVDKNNPENGGIIGFSVVTGVGLRCTAHLPEGEEDKTCQLRRIYIHPEYQGMGLGQKLLLPSFARACHVDESGSSTFEQMVVLIDEKNESSRRFHSNLGFGFRANHAKQEVWSVGEKIMEQSSKNCVMYHLDDIPAAFMKLADTTARKIGRISAASPSNDNVDYRSKISLLTQNNPSDDLIEILFS